MAWRWGRHRFVGGRKNAFHRIQGYREMPLLINALGDLIDTEEAVA